MVRTSAMRSRFGRLNLRLYDYIGQSHCRDRDSGRLRLISLLLDCHEQIEKIEDSIITPKDYVKNPMTVDEDKIAAVEQKPSSPPPDGFAGQLSFRSRPWYGD
ncbi:MAG: hypothetical protein SAJ12_02525 [Jaaginema sp. PMC 1079.18]|nr:hypothetical protein [Jaaginema sp. PMC 1080.18]MEC4849865.1 hypothetical protein [Jaaginema sp. PMC 1079.18]MEC4865253.1 hypothetical protein [Jaaginema sp. PMC 1078.18]